MREGEKPLHNEALHDVSWEINMTSSRKYLHRTRSRNNTRDDSPRYCIGPLMIEFDIIGFARDECRRTGESLGDLQE